MNLKNCTRWGVTALAAVALLVWSAPGAQAGDLRKCAKTLDKLASKFETAVEKFTYKCVDSVRNEAGKGAVTTKSSDKCEKMLAKIYDVSGAAGKSEVLKVRAGIEKVTGTGLSCEQGELEELGYMVSGVNAPGTALMDFGGDWLIKISEKSAQEQLMLDQADLGPVIKKAVDAMGGCPNPSYPNLCYLYDSLPSCHTHACALSVNTAATVNTGFGPIPLPMPGRRLVVTGCLQGGVPGEETSNLILLGGSGTRSFLPPAALLSFDVCLDISRTMGWCDCTGQAIPLNTNDCIDHDVNDAYACSGVTSGTAESCVCNDPNSLLGQPCTTAGCTDCTNSAGDSRCHSGTENSAEQLSYNGASAAGDCLALNTVALTLVDTSAGQEGPDGVSCTGDDTVAPSAPYTMPFTTGTSASIIKSYLAVEGGCSGGTTPGMNCMTDADCGGGGTCVGATINQEKAFTIGPGNPVGSCALLEASTLDGLAMVGSFPSLDGTAPLGDTVNTFILECDPDATDTDL